MTVLRWRVLNVMAINKDKQSLFEIFYGLLHSDGFKTHRYNGIYYIYI